jgi:hypothetical protein
MLVYMSIKNDCEQIIIIDSFSSVFMDNLNNEIEYDSSDLDSIRISSTERKSHTKTISQINENIQKISKPSKFICFRIFCDCSMSDE